MYYEVYLKIFYYEIENRFFVSFNNTRKELKYFTKQRI